MMPSSGGWSPFHYDFSVSPVLPDYTIADAGQGLRAGQKAAWGVNRRRFGATCFRRNGAT